MNVIGYVRVSTAGQARSGYSLTYQREDTETYRQEQCKASTRIHVKRRSFYGGMYQYDDVELDKHQVIL
ncbi:hypothetical protein AV654_32930 [Paenibacillus elgii]|uniref:Resolvase/invertase-type recombinase catalytic domain-containing protein n=1 Tax=Paenibacillus elgii TaxID=189691 RepID=A0A163UCL5_9BACL|nr:hypothetical protein [Paenibacillus elgii]KZE73141.1 hypothetical protein AV654_32930 [Paenibacillus elgii]